ncbi:MAG: tRNA lysidine(34) synthetase TilS [Clostridia bacterium]|nr:tRNA lysidine(34) synthetase TilS [Clostridia bacterium]
MSHSTALAGFRAPHALAGLAADTPVAVALSGGADSVALLLLLRDCPNLIAVHVHHGMRGSEADRDADFCRALTAKLSVPLYVLSVDVPARAKETGESPETAARAARYEAIAALLTEKKIPLLATAHHADDQLETMLQHLLRGSGTRGLSGIPACRRLTADISVVRPLLTVPKADILAYLATENQDFVTDSTNEELYCQRNKLRHCVLPLLTELQPNAAAIAARCAEALAEDEAYLDSLAADFLATAPRPLAATALQALPAPIFQRVLRRMLPEQPTARQMAAIKDLLATNRVHAALSLGGGTQLLLDCGYLTVTKERRGPAPTYELPLQRGENFSANADAVLYLLPIGTPAPEATTDYRYTASLNLCSSAVRGTLVARPRKQGDVILHGGLHKAVRRLATTKHLSPALRARMPLLADDAGLVAIPFGPVRDGAAVNPDLTVYISFN